MTLYGMDTVAGLAAGDQIDSGSRDIAELARRLDGALHAFDWTGTDADRTRETWVNAELPSLDAAVQQLAAIALLIRREAQAQDAASGTGGGPAGAAGTGGTGSSPLAQPSFLARVGAFLGSRIDAVFAGLGRTAGHAGDFLGKIGDVLTGRAEHSVAEIAASAIGTVGSGVGTVVGAVTGEDGNWFGEGTGVAGTPVAAPTDPLAAGPFTPVVTPPTDLPSLMQGVTDGYQVGSGPGSTGDVRITRVDNGTGTPGYVVAIPGTERWGPDAGPVGRDLSANVNLVAGNPTAAAESVQRAMEAAGIPPGAPVMLVGHSQGGIIAGALASDPAFTERYGQVNVMTYGAPIDHMRLGSDVSALQIQHGSDLVPRLDLGGVRTDGSSPTRVTTATLDSPGHFWELGTNHSYAEYRESVREALASQGDAGRTLRDYQSTLAPFLVQPGGSATAVDVPVSRGD